MPFESQRIQRRASRRAGSVARSKRLRSRANQRKWIDSQYRCWSAEAEPRACGRAVHPARSALASPHPCKHTRRPWRSCRGIHIRLGPTPRHKADRTDKDDWYRRSHPSPRNPSRCRAYIHNERATSAETRRPVVLDRRTQPPGRGIPLAVFRRARGVAVWRRPDRAAAPKSAIHGTARMPCSSARGVPNR